MLNIHTAEEAATIPASMWEGRMISPAYACSLGITVKSSASAVPTAPTGMAATVRQVSARPRNVPAIWPCGSVILTYVTSVEQVRTRVGGWGWGGRGKERNGKWILQIVMIFLNLKI